jgi:hypothetical protein
MTTQDIKDLQRAVSLLENPGFAIKLSNLVGSPIEHMLDKIPRKWSNKINDLSRMALEKSLSVAIKSINPNQLGGAHRWQHSIAAGVSGALGGAFGLAALAVELPVSTSIIMRSIADIARSEGENIQDEQTQLACLEVFAMGGRSEEDDAAESGYYIVRAAVANAIPNTTNKIMQEFSRSSGSLIGKVIGKIASRFGITVSQKAAVQLVPVLGAITGASINVLFIDHFQDMARGHFIVRRLERQWSRAAVEDAYHRIMKGEHLAV